MLKLIKTQGRLSANILSITSYQQFITKTPIFLSDRMFLHDETNNKKNRKYNEKINAEKKQQTSAIIGDKFDVFREEDAPVILDVEEERTRAKMGVVEVVQSEVDIFEGLNLERGKTGVFDIQDLVEVLKRDNAQDIFVCHVPKSLKYVDYFCIITARSPRHMKAIAEFVRKLFKFKMSSNDIIPRIEGKQSTEWIAIDLGNIALHIFSQKARVKYDLETLWTAGWEYDRELNKPLDPLLEMYEKNTRFIADLEPAEKHSATK